MVGLRGLGIAMLVLAAAVATPTLSVAQDPAIPAPEPPPAPLTPPSPPPPQPVQPEQPAEKQPAENEEPNGGGGSQAPAPAPAQVQTSAATQQGGGGGARASASATVSVGDNFYSPRSVSIAVGDTVTWRNDGAVPHTATADNGSFDTGAFDPGQSRSESFTRAGTISYYCTIHGRAQSGTVRVLAASGGGGGSGQGGSAGSGGGAPTEAQAVTSPDAAGTSTSLPATGFAAIGLALVGFALLTSGHLVGRLDGARRTRRRFLPIY